MKTRLIYSGVMLLALATVWTACVVEDTSSDDDDGATPPERFPAPMTGNPTRVTQAAEMTPEREGVRLVQPSPFRLYTERSGQRLLWPP